MSENTYEWCQRFHVDGLGHIGAAGTEYTNAQRDAIVSERCLHAAGWRTVRVTDEPGRVLIHACRPAGEERRFTPEMAKDFASRWAAWEAYASTPRETRPELPPTNTLGPRERERLFAWVRAECEWALSVGGTPTQWIALNTTLTIGEAYALREAAGWAT